MMCISLLSLTISKNPILGLWAFDGNLIVNTNNALLSNKTTKLESLFSLKNDKITALKVANGTICAGTYNGFIHIHSDSAYLAIELPVQNNGYPYLINGITLSKRKWLASTLEGTLFIIDKTGKYQTVALLNDKTNRVQNITSIAADNDNHIWVTSLDRVYFYTDIHKSRRKSNDFLASSNYNFRIKRLIESDLGVFSLSNDGNKNHLYLGILSASIMDALQKELTLPKEFAQKPIEFITYSDQSLWILGSEKLYEMKNYKWNEYDFQPTEAENITSFSVVKGNLYIGAENGLFSTNFN